jgi:hypothetical protein
VSDEQKEAPEGNSTDCKETGHGVTSRIPRCVSRFSESFVIARKSSR